MKASQVDKMNEAAVREYLKRLIEVLDEADCDDMLGPDGWRHFLMGEDD